MDLENAANIHISEKKRKKVEKEIEKSINESIKSHQKWVERMRKAGHSDEEINRMMCF